MWRTTIRSVGAGALRVHFESFDVDGRVYAYPHGGRAGTPFAGPYRHLGPQGDGDFWSDVVPSDSVTIEFVLRRGAERPDGLPFRVNEIAHIRPGAFPSQRKTSTWSPVTPWPGEPRAIVGCHLDVSCYPDWQRAGYASEALLYITRPEGTASCSGTLINTRYDSDDVLLMLTAAHCISDNQTAQNTVFYWNYETDRCYGQPRPLDLVSTTGATLVVARGPDRYDDFALLKLDMNDVLSVTGTIMRGWSPSWVPTGTDVVNVSHPDGAFKRIAFGVTTAVNWRGLSDVGFGSVRWLRGTVEHGSSGSGVLRERDSLLIGVIGGSSMDPPCDTSYRAYFNRFDRIYDEIEEYLESESSLVARRRITIRLGTSRDQVILVESTGGGYTLHGDPIESGRIVTAGNGNRYRLILDASGNWAAVFIAESIEVPLSEGFDSVTVLRNEDRRYQIGGKPISNGSVIAHHDRGTYRLSSAADGTWSAEPILADAPGSGRGFSIEAVAGSGSYGFRGDGGQARAARLANPFGVAVSDSGNVYIADTENHRIRMVSPTGVITTVAGTGAPGSSGDRRAATRARLSSPKGLALDAEGRLYIADSGNHRIRVIDSSGTISTVAGTGHSGFTGDNGLAAEARLSRPSAVAIDAFGEVYIADTGNHRIRKVANGIVTTVAGSSRSGFEGDGGPADLAALSSPEGVAVDMFGTIFIADTRNHRVRKVDLDGSITTVMGTGRYGYGGDGALAVRASLALPQGVAVDWRGGIYIADSGNDSVRRIDSLGIAETIAGTGRRGRDGDGGPSDRALLNSPAGLYVDVRSEVYIADAENRSIRRLRADWEVIPARDVPVSVVIPLGWSGDVARLWRSGNDYTYRGSPFEPGDYVWSSNVRYQLNSTPSGGLRAVYSPPDYSQWLEEYRGRAEEGDPVAQSTLGALYYFGDGVPKDFGEALRWFRLAAAQGVAYAQTSLGYMHERGYAVDIDLVGAAEWYRLAAAQGWTSAQYRLARLLQSGDGVERNHAAAARLFRLAAVNDVPGAQVRLGRMYRDAIGVGEYPAEAAKWFFLAAQQGDGWGQANLGFLYYYGRGVERNHFEAATWFRRAADQGSAWAQSWLGSLYERGEGVLRNLAESATWYRLAAEQGYAFAQWQLGQAYSEGAGVTRDVITAYVWLSLADENGNENASSDLAVLRRTMTTGQIRDANSHKARCRSSGYESCP